jgi:hypothetical protein
MRYTKVLFAGLVLAICACSMPAFADTVINFDSIAATCCYIDVTPGTGRGPLLVFPELTLNGGVVMDNTGWLNLETSAPNLYGTADSAGLADGSFLPGFITGQFSSAVSSMAMDIINGSNAADFTLSAYDASSFLLGSQTVSLDCFSCGAAAVSHVSLAFAGIDHFTVTSAQGQGNIDFAIDTIAFPSSPSVPEPASIFLMGTGLGVVGLIARRRRNL